MIRKHIDLIAIGALLLVAALFTGAKRLAVALPGGPPARLMRMHPGNAYFEEPAVPHMPPMPHISIVRD